MHDEIKVTVIEFGDRKHYQMQWRDPLTGAKKTKSTGIERTGKRKDRQEAERVAGEHEKALRNGLYKPTSKVTWGEFRLRYEDEVLSGLAEGTFRKVSSIFNSLESVLRLGEETRLATIPERLSGYQAELRKAGRSEDTIHGHLAHLKAALRWAADEKLLAVAPKVKMPSRTKGDGKAMKGRPITGEEFERMLGKVEEGLIQASRRRDKDQPTPKRTFSQEAQDRRRDAKQELAAAAAPSWKHLLRGLWLSGLRLGEALELYWDRDDRLCVDLSGKRPMLRIPAELEKGHKDRLLPITPDFAEFLLATPEGERTGPVFPLASMRPTAGKMDCWRASRIIGAIGKAAGVVVDVDPVSGKVKYASAHDLRRSFGERWAVRVMPQVLMEIMRHESIDTTMRYYVGQNAQRTAEAVYAAFSAFSQASGNTFGNTQPISGRDSGSRIDASSGQ